MVAVRRKMVEAAGIEPASENESYETTTCGVRLFCSTLVVTSSDGQDPGLPSSRGFAGRAGTSAID